MPSTDLAARWRTAILCDPRLGPAAVRVLALVAGDLPSTGKIRLNRAALAARLHVTERAVKEALQQAVTVGVLDVVTRGGGRGGGPDRVTLYAAIIPVTQTLEPSEFREAPDETRTVERAEFTTEKLSELGPKLRNSDGRTVGPHARTRTTTAAHQHAPSGPRVSPPAPQEQVRRDEEADTRATSPVEAPFPGIAARPPSGASGEQPSSPVTRARENPDPETDRAIDVLDLAGLLNSDRIISTSVCRRSA